MQVQGMETMRPIFLFGGKIMLRIFTAWFDMWIGAYWDAAKRVLYVCPLPCLVFAFHIGKRVN